MLSIEELHQQVVVMINNLKKVSAAEKKLKPSSHFGNTYNQILNQAKNLRNDHNVENWPPILEVTPATQVASKNYLCNIYRNENLHRANRG